jgi:hypothetical protein
VLFMPGRTTRIARTRLGCDLRRLAHDAQRRAVQATRVRTERDELGGARAPRLTRLWLTS